MSGMTPEAQLALVIADAEELRAEVMAAYAEVDRLRAQVAAVEKVREKYKRNMKRLSGSMMLSYCDPYEVNRAAVRDLDAALASGDEVQP